MEGGDLLNKSTQGRNLGTPLHNGSSLVEDIKEISRDDEMMSESRARVRRCRKRLRVSISRGSITRHLLCQEITRPRTSRSWVSSDIRHSSTPASEMTNAGGKLTYSFLESDLSFVVIRKFVPLTL